MKICYLSIRNFRGIKQLDWYLPISNICLIGPGDSTKTTILDAIEIATYPSYFLQLHDTDFYRCAIDSPIEIMIGLSDVPNEFYNDSKFGMYFRGLKDNMIYDEPHEDHTQILTIKFTYTKELEPEWEVFVERDIDKKEISSRNREKLCVFRVGNHVDKNFTWIRGSILNQWSGNIEASKEVLNAATRALKTSFGNAKVDGLDTILDEITQSAKVYGVNQSGTYNANIDAKSVGVGVSAISLHEDGIPLRQMGFGSKRLLTLALQIENCGDSSIILADEIESGLEPYRLRGLIKTLKSRLKNKGQVITTTHSPIAVVEFDATDLVVVRTCKGITECLPVPSTLQNIVRKVPEGLLSKNIIVCEGQTEQGFLMAFEEANIQKGLSNFSFLGTSLVNGGGNSFIDVALGLAKLKYRTCVFVDSDCTAINEKIPRLEGVGIQILSWPGNTSIEERIALDLSEELLYRFIGLAIQIKTDEGLDDAELRIVQALDSKFQRGFKTLGDIKAAGIYSVEFSKVIGTCAKKGEWFKSISKGKLLGDFMMVNLDALKGTETINVLEKLSIWLYEQ